MKHEFLKKDLEIISHALYQAYSKLGVEHSNFEKENKEKAEFLQREINNAIKNYNGVVKNGNK